MSTIEINITHDRPARTVIIDRSDKSVTATFWFYKQLPMAADDLKKLSLHSVTELYYSSSSF